MKNLLLLAFYFPPRGHIASYRSGCFAKFLPENGWLPTVVCDAWPPGRANYEPDFVGVIPKEVEVHGILNEPPLGFYERFVLRKMAPHLWPHRAPIRWWEKARAQVLELTRTRRFDAIWATSDPLVPLALAAETAQANGLPWVADIRDSFNVQRRGSWYKRPMLAWQERRLCGLASRVVTVSEGLAHGLRRKIGREVAVIHNGFDPTLLPQTRPERSPLFTVVYAGNLVAPQQDPSPLLKAVWLCLQRKLIPGDGIQVQFYGTDPGVIERTAPGALEKLPVKVFPQAPHKEMLRIMMASSVLLVLTVPSQRGVLTGKVFDYLAAGRPILAVPEDQGAISDLLRRTGAGVAITDVEEIARQLVQWHGLWKAGAEMTSGRNETEIARYSRRTQAKNLAGILDEIAGKR
jgi:glycosyltransferase involved in cell wall biosynthesis